MKTKNELLRKDSEYTYFLLDKEGNELYGVQLLDDAIVEFDANDEAETLVYAEVDSRFWTIVADTVSVIRSKSWAPGCPIAGRGEILMRMQ